MTPSVNEINVFLLNFILKLLEIKNNTAILL
jgi:hypothetical protein